MRTVNLRQAAGDPVQERLAAPATLLRGLRARVNAYLYRYRDKLPMDLAQSGYRPEYWKPEDSALVFALLNFGLAVNLQEEVASLTLAQKVGSDKLAWLTPTYPDENLPFDEAESSRACAWTGRFPARGRRGRGAAGRSAEHARGRRLEQRYRATTQPQRQEPDGQRHPSATSMPSVWNYVQIRSPKRPRAFPSPVCRAWWRASTASWLWA